MNSSYDGHLCTVFALEHYSPLNTIRALGGNGVNPIYTSIGRHYEAAIFSEYISKLRQTDSIEKGFRPLLDEYGNLDSSHRPYIVFLDDKSVGYFNLHYDERKGKLITYNAGMTGRINRFMDKYNIQQLAKKHSFNISDGYVISKSDNLPKDLCYPIITKGISPNSDNWENDVYVCQNEQELRSAVGRVSGL